MPASGSILGNAVRRLEDPALLTGAGKYVDDLVEPGMLHVAFVRSTVAHAESRVGRRQRGACRCRASWPCTTRAATTSASPSLQQFPMMPETLNRPIFATDKVRFVGDVDRGRRRRDAARRRSTPPRASSSNTTRCRRSRARSTRWRPTRRCCSPTTARTCASAPTFPPDGDADPLAGADVVAEVTMVSQRLAGVPMETNGILAVPGDGGLTCWISHQAPHSIHGGVRPDARAGTGPAARRVPVGGRRLRPEGGAVRRAPRDRGGRADSWTAR